MASGLVESESQTPVWEWHGRPQGKPAWRKPRYARVFIECRASCGFCTCFECHVSRECTSLDCHVSCACTCLECHVSCACAPPPRKPHPRKRSPAKWICRCLSSVLPRVSALHLRRTPTFTGKWAPGPLLRPIVRLWPTCVWRQGGASAGTAV